MRTSIDKAGRLVLPKVLRDRLGLAAGEVDVFASGSGLRAEPVASDEADFVAGDLPVGDPRTGQDRHGQRQPEMQLPPEPVCMTYPHRSG